MALGLLELEEVKINTGLAGKIIGIYSTNNTGKSKVSSQLFPKQTLFVATEKGYNSLGGIRKIDVLDWKTFRDVVKELTDKKTIEKMQQVYKCIVVDVADRLPEMCQTYICSKNMVENLGDIPWGGGHAQYRTEFSNQINKLALSGYCIILICHQSTATVKDPVTGEDVEYTFPKNTDKKVGEILKDLPDFFIYLQNNHTDENGNVVLSTGICSHRRNVFARSRYTQCETTIEPFTAENLRRVVREACEKEAELLGVETVNFEQEIEQMIKEQTSLRKTRPQLLEEIKPILTRLYQGGRQEEVTRIVEKYLGEGAKVSEANDGQIDKLTFILNDLTDLEDSINA